MAQPYLVAVDERIRIIPLLTVPEAAPNGYRMAGVPDGIGAYVTGPTTFDVLVTHELRYNQGGPRCHAASGAFVSRWRFDKSKWCGGDGTLELMWGGDLIKKVYVWDYASTPGKHRKGSRVPLERLCSADLPVVAALHFTDGEGEEWGTTERIFLGGEETHTKYKPDFGRAFAHVVTGPNTGSSYELPRLGRGSWENVLACPTAQRKTITVLPDDATAETSTTWRLREPTSELYLYVGEKQKTGCDFEKAGLHNGTLYGVQVFLENNEEIVLAEHDELGFGGPQSQGKHIDQARFRLIDLGDRSKDDPKDVPGIALQKDSLEHKVTQFLRLEDGSWDPREDHPGHFWVVTTGDVDGRKGPKYNSRLFHLVFDDIEHPEIGGKIRIEATARVSGTWNFRLLDSVCVDRAGRVFMQEDPDKLNVVSRTLVLDGEGQPRVVACANPELFDPKKADEPDNTFLTTNEETAGIVPMDDILGEGWYLTAVQCNDEAAWKESMRPEGMPCTEWEQLKADLVRPGQLLAIYVPQGIEDELPDIPSFCKSIDQ